MGSTQKLGCVAGARSRNVALPGLSWIEDEMFPREDVLSEDLTVESDVLPIAHPEWFRIGDIVRVGDDDLYDTGEINERGQPILRSNNEAVRVLSIPSMKIQRALGSAKASSRTKGEKLFIIAGMTEENTDLDDD